MAIYIGLTGKKITYFILFSILNFLNIYLVWHPMKIYFLPYKLMSNFYFQWFLSAGIVISGLWLYTFTLNTVNNYEKTK